MTAAVHHFALIGRSFPVAAYQGLHEASLVRRAARRDGRAAIKPAARVWRPSDEPILVPARLRA